MTAKLGIIGAGAMGGAILRGAVKAQVIQASDVFVADISDSRREDAKQLGCAVSAIARHAVEADQVIFAVKPQMFHSIAGDIGQLEKPTIVISVMAGLSSPVIRQRLGTNARVIRVMPNTPCQIGAGISAVALGEGARTGDEQFAMQLVGALGNVVVVDESMMHAATAVSGSGPAYIFLLAEAMEQAAIQVGLDRHTAKKLTYNTILGAGKLLTEKDNSDADALRTAVTSPGGTTAAALEVLFEREFPQIIAEAITAARDRGIELDIGEDN